MTLAKPREHALSKRLRRIAIHVESHPDPRVGAADATNMRAAAARLEQTISVLGIWKDPERIKTTGAYKQVRQLVDDYERRHPTV